MLICAAALGDVEVVSQHIGERGQKDKLGQTALILAAQNGRDKTVKLLMEHEGGASGWTRLIYSAYLGDVDAIRDNLHEKGCKDIDGKTALIWAARQGHKGVVKVLFEHEKGVVDNEGSTAFTYALTNKFTGIALLLRECEAPSWTPLMCAALTGDIELAKSHLSDKDKKNSDGDTALMIAARVGHKDIVKLLDPTDKAGVTALMRAAERGDLEAVRALMPLQKGRKTTGFAHINRLWTPKGGTALMMAAACGHAEVVRLLVEDEGGMVDKKGVTALMHAAENGHTDCVKLLLEKEANMQRNDGWTALMFATARGHVECVKLLLKKEAGLKGENGLTALMKAAENGYVECVNLIIEKEASMQDNDGRTALMKAVYWNRIECARLLAEREKDMKTTYKWFGYLPGTTALDIAKERGHTEIVSILSDE